jgi:hypothetical protein
MVLALELTEEEVLECLKKILKGVSVIPHTVSKYCADNPSPAVSCLFSVSTLSFIFPLLLVLSVFISLTSLIVVGYLQDLGRNFIDLIPTVDNPFGVKARENLAGASSTSKSQATTILLGAFIAETIPYVEYVPCPVPRAPHSSKRMRADDTSAGMSSTKKPRQSSTRPGTQVVGSMLLGEHFNIFAFFYSLFMFLTEYFLLSQMVLWLSCSRARMMRMMMRPLTLISELLYFGFVVIILGHFF